MGKSGKLFLEERQKEYEPFDHKANFCKKVKENWLSNEEFTKLKSANLVTLTKALINKKMDIEYQDEIMKLICEKEPRYINSIDYIKLVSKTPIGNMKRVFEKYDNVNYFIKSHLKDGLELLISNKNNG
jgi:predicted transcriptional regulator